MRFRLLVAGAWALISAVAALHGGAAEAEPFRFLTIERHQLKWGEPRLGTPARVTWRLIDEPQRFASAINCRSMAPSMGSIGANRVTPQAFWYELREAFAAWSEFAAIDFVAVRDGPADILIGAQAEPRGRAFTNVEFDRRAPGSGPRRLTQATICLNPAEPWKIGFDGNLDAYDLRYALMHEIGHAIGLDHPAIDGVIMHFRYGETFRDLQPGDVRGVTALYGPRRTDRHAAAEEARPKLASYNRPLAR